MRPNVTAACAAWLIAATLPAAAEGAVEVDIRGKHSPARLVKPPFVDPSVKES